MSDRLAYHFSFLVSGGSLSIFKDHTYYDPKETDHFENFNSTNWNTVRFKPPPDLDSDAGWMLEFRSLDNQLTDFENAVFITLVNLTAKILNDFDINISLPLSLSEENMERAHSVDSAFKQKFWFRKNIVNTDSDYTKNPAKEKKWKLKNEDFTSGLNNSSSDQFVEMTIADIFEGNEEIGNTGLIEIFQKYMEVREYNDEHKKFYNSVLGLLLRRAKGELKTGARYMRDFVLNHPDYKKDSVVSDSICYDLVKEIRDLSMCKKWDKSLLGEMPEFMEEYFD